MKISPPEAIRRHLLVPAAVLTLYCALLSFLLSRLLPEYDTTVTTVFLRRAGGLSLLLTAAALIVFLVGKRLIRGGTVRWPAAGEMVSPADLLLVLVPLAPVVQYIFKNQDILSLPGAFLVIAVFAVFSLLLVFAVPWLLAGAASGRTLTVLGMAFAFIITNMPALSARCRWFQTGSLKVQLVVFGGVFAISWLLYRKPAGRKLARLLAVVFCLSSGAALLADREGPRAGGESADRPGGLAEVAGSRAPLSTPNIYLLIYDSYVANETLLGYGINNAGQEEYLERRGFKIYPHAYSVGEYTIPSMSRVLEAAAEYPGPRRRGVSGSGTVHRLLKGYGYQTSGIFQSDRFFQGIGSGYDFSFPAVNDRATPRMLVKAILMGEFRFDVVFDRPTRQQFEEEKRGACSAVSDRPRFVYIHDCLPGHSQISGKCRPDETELYAERLAEANAEMKLDLEAIIRSDPGALVIVAGDHGPYLTKNCVGTGEDYDISEISRQDIQDRYGSFLAIRWPEEDPAGLDDITVLQDVFPAVFGYLFQDGRFRRAKVPSRTLAPSFISGAEVVDGVIHGGINDGEALFLAPQ